MHCVSAQGVLYACVELCMSAHAVFVECTGCLHRLYWILVRHTACLSRVCFVFIGCTVVHMSAQEVLCVCGLHCNALRDCTGCIVGWTVMHHVSAWGLLQGCTVVYYVFVCTGYTECRWGMLRVCMGCIVYLCVCTGCVYVCGVLCSELCFCKRCICEVTVVHCVSAKGVFWGVL